MKDKVIKLKNGLQYSVLDEMIVDRVPYIFGVQVDNAAGIITENFIIMKIEYIEGKVFVNDVDNNEIYDKVSKMFLERIKDIK